jgi:hypothetical protein
MAFKSVFDKTFRYRDSSSTDIRQTFERLRREQRLQEQRGQAGSNELRCHGRGLHRPREAAGKMQ